MDYTALAIRMIRRCACLLLLACSTTVNGANGTLDGRQLAQELRGNVVRVEGLGDGFGFIVAQQQSQIFIVTVNHVVRDVKDKSKPVFIYFYHDQKTPVPATLLRRFDSKRDVAMIRAPMPSGLSWRREVMGRPENLELGVSKLWYVGQFQIWEIPSGPGFVSQLQRDRMILNMRIPSGTSGAPIIAADGIVGLILAERRDERSYVTRIDTVKELVTGWSYPWHMKPDPRLEPLVAEATRYYELGIYDEAFRRYREAALKGNPHAMARLGMLYMAGNGVKADSFQALEWFKKAADAGDPEGMVGLGSLYGGGLGVSRDAARAAEWMRRAAELGSVEGKFFLANSYEKGLGVSQDLGRAIRLYEEACRLGHKAAEQRLRALGAGSCK
jgi:hypothetical protein